MFTTGLHNEDEQVQAEAFDQVPLTVAVDGVTRSEELKSKSKTKGDGVSARALGGFDTRGEIFPGHEPSTEWIDGITGGMIRQNGSYHRLRSASKQASGGIVCVVSCVLGKLRYLTMTL